MSKIYKYFSHDVFDLVFDREGFCGLKFSLPKDYNDPYELFLALDLSVPTEHLATYSDIIQEIPQFPTTCFSRSPIVSPMWAHYANNHSGFVLELDTSRIAEHFPDSSIHDVDYLEKPKTDLHELLARASVIAKPRYAAWLRDAVLSTAYFSKYADWAYEQETRMVVGIDDAENIAGNIILYVPIECVTAIIFGSKFPESKRPSQKEVSDRYELDTYSVAIGKSYPVPYLVNDKHDVFIFSEGEISEPDFICDSCSEPLTEDGENCPWCRISDEHKHTAAMRNPFRILDHLGQLDDYLKEVEKIKRGSR